jgi:hypothetical protein
MARVILAAAALSLLLITSPSVALDVKCDDVTLATLRGKASTIPDETLRQSAQNHLTMAKQAMADNKTQECVDHITKAREAIGTK